MKKIAIILILFLVVSLSLGMDYLAETQQFNTYDREEDIEEYLTDFLTWIEDDIYSQIALRVNRLLRITVDKDGNVGIGTTSPSRELHVQASSETEITTEATDSDTWAMFSMGTDNNVRAAYMLAYGSTHATQADQASIKNLYGDISLWTGTSGSATERIRIESGGNVDVTGTDGAFMPPRLTTTQRDALTPSNGMLIYNTTTTRFEGYENGSWVDI